ncbi:MAG: integrase core domain-containing protein [Terracidiphilus sp.]
MGLRCPAPLTFIKAYVSVAEARGGIGAWLAFYNDERVHQALGYCTPREMFEAAPACGYVDDASALTTFPQAPQQQEGDSIDKEKVLYSFVALSNG